MSNQVNWTAADDTLLMDLREQGFGWAYIRDVFKDGRSDDCCRGRHQRITASGYSAEPRPTVNKPVTHVPDALECLRPVFDAITDKDKEKANKRLDTKDFSRIKQTAVFAEVIADRLEKHLIKFNNTPHYTNGIYAVNKSKGITSTEEMGALLSDLHIGHQHTFEETGIDGFDIDVFTARFKNAINQVIQLYERHCFRTNITCLNVFAGGDNVGGMRTVGAWPAITVPMDIDEQFMYGYDMWVWALEQWAKVFPKIRFHGVYGNHGRMAPEGLEKSKSNWDRLIYRMLEKQFGKNPKFEFNVPQTPWAMAEVLGNNFLLIHGDELGKASGAPVERLAEFMKNWRTSRNIPVHCALAGHYHSSAEFMLHGCRAMINGDFVGGDEYSLAKNMPHGNPEQKVFGISKAGITWRYNINLKNKDI